MPVLINVPVLDGVSKKDIARNITVDKADAEAVDNGSAGHLWCDIVGH